MSLDIGVGMGWSVGVSGWVWVGVNVIRCGGTVCIRGYVVSMWKVYVCGCVIDCVCVCGW